MNQIGTSIKINCFCSHISSRNLSLAICAILPLSNSQLYVQILIATYNFMKLHDMMNTMTVPLTQRIMFYRFHQL